MTKYCLYKKGRLVGICNGVQEVVDKINMSDEDMITLDGISRRIKKRLDLPNDHYAIQENVSENKKYLDEDDVDGVIHFMEYDSITGLAIGNLDTERRRLASIICRRKKVKINEPIFINSTFKYPYRFRYPEVIEPWRSELGVAYYKNNVLMMVTTTVKTMAKELGIDFKKIYNSCNIKLYNPSLNSSVFRKTNCKKPPIKIIKSNNIIDKINVKIRISDTSALINKL